jgi:hypothetical protein
MSRVVGLVLLLTAFLTGTATGFFVKTPPPARTMALWGVPVVPPVTGYAEGREIRFIHTEASEARVAQRLTTMMGSPVLLVPSLAAAPAAMVAPVYVFTNGIPGAGPFDFQPDVFEHPPGSDGYRPLRALHLVTWQDARAARLLTSAREVRAALDAGAIAIERPGIVVNMPLLTWPGGGR